MIQKKQEQNQLNQWHIIIHMKMETQVLIPLKHESSLGNLGRPGGPYKGAQEG